MIQLILTSYQGLDVNSEIDGRLPLHYASDYGQLEVIKYLCSKVSFIQSKLLQGVKIKMLSMIQPIPTNLGHGYGYTHNIN